MMPQTPSRRVMSQRCCTAVLGWVLLYFRLQCCTTVQAGGGGGGGAERKKEMYVLAWGMGGRQLFGCNGKRFGALWAPLSDRFSSTSPIVWGHSFPYYIGAIAVSAALH